MGEGPSTDQGALARRRFLFVLSSGVLALAASVIVSLMFGAFGPFDALPAVEQEGRAITLQQFFALLVGQGPEAQQEAILNIRLPRIILAAIAGAILAAAGATMQGVFRNPLAEPFILGVSAGAALGAALNLVVGIGGPSRYLALPAMAFVGALLATFASFLIAQISRGPKSETLLLAGVAINSFLTAILLAFLFFAAEQFRSLFFWVLGGFDRASWNAILILASTGALTTAYLVSRAQALNLLMLGDEQAASLGVEVAATKRNLLVAASLLTAVTVAFTGVIGFVGLIVPHMLRLLVGADNRLLLPISTIAGGIFLVWADLVARSLLEIGEMPVGIITAVCGAPFFLYLLARRRTLHAAV